VEGARQSRPPSGGGPIVRQVGILHLVQLDRTTKSLLQDEKKVGPNLKDVRLKLNKNWIPVWLKKPTDFRATTKMPNFRLSDEQIKSISAYLWQS